MANPRYTRENLLFKLYGAREMQRAVDRFNSGRSLDHPDDTGSHPEAPLTSAVQLVEEARNICLHRARELIEAGEMWEAIRAVEHVVFDGTLLPPEYSEGAGEEG